MAGDSMASILVVDDYEPMRTLLVETLKILDYENVSMAENGVEALEKVKQTKFDLIISDWSMPEMDGMDLLREIRANETIKDIPVVMITAIASPENIKEAISAGVSGYLMKPVTVSTLEEKIKEILT